MYTPVTCVGLFRTAVVLHNDLGCMAGCVAGSAVLKRYKKRLLE